MDEYRETIWGIRSKDRGWFQLLTLMGGTAGSVILTLLELDPLAADAPPNEVARNIVLGIGASFVASGFISWGLLQAKEMAMSIADWIRDATERRRERWRQEGREEGIQVGRREGIQEGREEGYSLGYSDSQEGKPPQPPAEDNIKSEDDENGNR